MRFLSSLGRSEAVELVLDVSLIDFLSGAVIFILVISTEVEISGSRNYICHV